MPASRPLVSGASSNVGRADIADGVGEAGTFAAHRI
jgi:hypothetical protein